MLTASLLEILPPYLAIFYASDILYVCLYIILILIFIRIVIIFFKLKRIVSQKYIFLEVKFSSKALKSAFSTKQLFTIIHSLQSPLSLSDKVLGIKKIVSFELVSTREDGIRYVIRVPDEDVSVVKKTLLAYVPAIETSERLDYLPQKVDNITVRKLIFSKQFVFPLQDQSILKEFDPIAYLTAQMTKLGDSEQIAIQIVSTPITKSSHSGLLNQIRQLNHMLMNDEDISSKLNKGFVWFLLNMLYSTKKRKIRELSKSKQELYKDIEDKINQPLYEVTARLLVKSEDNKNRDKRIKGLLSSFESFRSPYQSIRIQSTLLRNRIFESMRFYFFKNRLFSMSENLILSASELASIYHFPYSVNSKAEDLIQNKSPKLPSPLNLKNSKLDQDIVFAHNTYGETTTPIGLTLEERRRHMYIIGATGTGKTTLLLHMIHKDIENGKGIAVLDPHGDLTEKLLGVMPDNRVKDVVYFNPYDTDMPIGLNVLELDKKISETELSREKDLIVSSLISIFHKLYPARYSGPRMEHVLRNTVLTALETEKPTLFTVYKLLTNTSYRKHVVEKLTDPILKDFWKHEFEKMGSFQKADLISPITNKLGRFLTTSITRSILNQNDSKLNFTDIMENQKILICDLSKGKIGEDTSSFLGSLIVAKIQLAALKRVLINQEDRKDFFLYIDEFQNFATMAFAQILSEARKYRLNSILAHQTVSQIEDKDLLKVILANVGTIISFRTNNPSDEDTILPFFTPQVEKNEISNLPSYNFYIKVNALVPQDAFTGSVENFDTHDSKFIRQKVIQYSKNTYGQNIRASIIPLKKKTIIKQDKEAVRTSLAPTKRVRVSI